MKNQDEKKPGLPGFYNRIYYAVNLLNPLHRPLL